MTALALLPDVEQLVADVLRNRPEVAAIVGTRVFTVLPTTHKSWPAIRVTRAGSDPYSPVHPWAEQVVIRVECWGGDRSTARLLSETVRAVLCGPDWIREHDAGVVVSTCSCALLESFDPTVSTTTGAARPRYVVQSASFLHRTEPSTP